MENNKIVLIDNQQAIYGSIPCPNDNEYDYIFLKDISKITLAPIKLKCFRGNDIKIDNTNINYTLSHDTNKVSLKLLHYDNMQYDVELQAFVDLLFDSVYSEINITEHNTIKQITEEFLNKNYIPLLEKQILLDNKQYQIVGRILDNKNNIIGIINSFNVESDNDQLYIRFNDIVSYFPISHLEINKIEFFTGTMCICIHNIDVINSMNGILKTMKCKILKYNITHSNTSIIAESVTQIENEEIFLAKRIELLKDNEDLIEKTTHQNNDISNYFDDFDF